MDDLTIARLRKGDVEVFEQVVRDYQNRIYSMCLNMLNNSADAEDATQICFIKAYRNIAKFKGNSKLSTWLYRIASNTCIDIIRKKKRRQETSFEVESDEPYLLQIPSNEITPLEHMEQTEMKELIAESIGKLPEISRTIIVLREIKQLEYEEIARVLDISIGTVKSRINRARSALQKILAEKMV